MNQYINTSYRSYNNSFKHSFVLVFKKIETVFFSFLCIVFLIASRVDDNFHRDVSLFFINISLPVVKILAFPFDAAINISTEFSELVSAKRENKKLTEELEKLQSFYIAALNVNNENKELKEALQFTATKSSTFKVARFLGSPSQIFNQKILIDAGENRDIKKGQIVTTIRGIIGRVDEVFADKSRLILLNDPTSRIPVISSETRARGILAGNGSNLMEILYLPENHNIKVGDLIFTSGDGDTMPSGWLVGSVKKVEADVVLVAMAQDLSEVNVVTIVEY